MSIKWNTVNNLFFLVCGMAIVYFLMLKPMEKREIARYDALMEEIVEIAKQPKYSIQNDFEKMKPKKGSDIIIDLDNNMEVNDLAITVDSTAIEDTVKVTFWRKWFPRKSNN